jgi:hypothetical protein
VRWGRSCAEARTSAPQELDETLLEVVARRDDRVWSVGPDDEHSLVTLVIATD